MKKLSLSLADFKKYCEELQPKQYIYDSENQPRETKQWGIRHISRFKIMFVCLHPDIIFFKNDLSSLSLNCVKRVLVTPKTAGVGTVFTIICDNAPEVGGEIAHVFIAS